MPAPEACSVCCSASLPWIVVHTMCHRQTDGAMTEPGLLQGTEEIDDHGAELVARTIHMLRGAAAASVTAADCKLVTVDMLADLSNVRVRMGVGRSQSGLESGSHQRHKLWLNVASGTLTCSQSSA